MKTRLNWNVCLLTTILFNLLNAQIELTPELKHRLHVEEQFKHLRPNLDSLDSEPWPELNNMTHQYLKELCGFVVVNITGSFTTVDRLSYKYAPDKEMPTDRIIRRAPVQFQNEGIKTMTLVECAYHMLTFYLAKGGKESVFRLSRDKKKGVYLFESGLHHIKYNSIINTTHYVLGPRLDRQFRF